MYGNYQKFVNDVLINSDFNFKSNRSYNSILEHVSKEQGESYIIHIKEHIDQHFPSKITTDKIRSFLEINDHIGGPVKETFTYDGELIETSPTSLRYVLHALLILSHLRRCPTAKIVEVGCGYGGLFLAINFFSDILKMTIDKYYFVDLPEICSLISKYLTLNNAHIHINYSVHSAYNYGADINDGDLYFISNYCFTEIDKEHRDKYISTLLPRVSHGFITWQTVFQLPIDQMAEILKNKPQPRVVEEYPQTGPSTHKNYYVCF